MIGGDDQAVHIWFGNLLWWDSRCGLDSGVLGLQVGFQVCISGAAGVPC